MIVAGIIEEIINWIKREENPIIYQNWNVCISYKEMNQFKLDAPKAMREIQQISTIEPSTIKELESSLEGLGINCCCERDPKYVYVYKTL